MPIIKITCLEPSFAMISHTRMTAGNNLTVKVRSPLKVDRLRSSRVRSGVFAPVLAPLLLRRWIMVLLAVVALALVALAAGGVTVWQCPLRSTLGVICPGCGLTRAMVLLVQGYWQASFALHAFAPIFLCIWIILATGSVLPARLQQRAADRIAAFERRTGIVALLGFGLILYWIMRIVNLI